MPIVYPLAIREKAYQVSMGMPLGTKWLRSCIYMGRVPGTMSNSSKYNTILRTGMTQQLRGLAHHEDWSSDPSVIKLVILTNAYHPSTKEGEDGLIIGACYFLV